MLNKGGNTEELKHVSMQNVLQIQDCNLLRCKWKVLLYSLTNVLFQCEIEEEMLTIQFLRHQIRNGGRVFYIHQQVVTFLKNESPPPSKKNPEHHAMIRSL